MYKLHALQLDKTVFQFTVLYLMKYVKIKPNSAEFRGSFLILQTAARKFLYIFQILQCSAKFRGLRQIMGTVVRYYRFVG